jgi:hypothetical protein
VLPDELADMVDVISLFASGNKVVASSMRVSWKSLALSAASALLDSSVTRCMFHILLRKEQADIHTRLMFVRMTLPAWAPRLGVGFTMRFLTRRDNEMASVHPRRQRPSTELSDAL